MSADVIGQNDDDARPLSSDVESLSSPHALPSADRFADLYYTRLILRCFDTVVWVTGWASDL